MPLAHPRLTRPRIAWGRSPCSNAPIEPQRASKAEDGVLNGKLSFEEHVLPLRGVAYNLAYWILKNRDEAEDVVQESYLRAFRAFPRFSGSHVRSWLLVIVRNTAFTAIGERERRRKFFLPSGELRAFQDSDQFDPASTEPSPEARMISDADRQRLITTLSGLPAIYREVLALREMEGLAYDEIAAVIGRPVGTVMSRLSRARTELRKAMLQQLSGDCPNAV